MAIEPYRAQVRNTVVLRMPPRGAGAQGEAVGQGIARIGGALGQAGAVLDDAEENRLASEHRLAMAEKGRERTRQAARGMSNKAQADLEIPELLRELGQRVPPDAAGYTVQAREIVAERYAETLVGIDDEEVILNLQQSFQNSSLQYGLRAEAYEMDKRIGVQKENISQFESIVINQALRADPDFNMAEKLQDYATFLKLTDLTPDERAAAYNDHAERLETAAWGGQIGAGKAAEVRAAMDRGATDRLPPEMVKMLRAQAIAAEAAQARAAELAASEARKAATDALQSLQVDIDNGTQIPLPTIKAALDRAKAAGVPEDDLKRFAYLAEGQIDAAQVLGMATPQLEAQVTAAVAKRNAGQLDDAGARWLDRAVNELGKRDDDLGAKLGPLLKGGLTERVQGVTMLAAMPVEQRWRAAEAAGDSRAAVVASLPEQYRIRAVQGAAVRRERPADFLPPKSATVTDPAKEMDRTFRAVMGPLVSDVGPAYSALRESAADLMAASNPDGWNPRDFGNSIQVMMGRNKRSGTNLYQGGIAAIEGRMTELPMRWTGAEFATRYARHQFEGAITGTGVAAVPADVRKHYRLQHQGENESGESLYVLIDPRGRRLQQRGKDGSISDYVLPVSARPR